MLTIIEMISSHTGKEPKSPSSHEKKETDWKEENFLPLQPKNDVWSDVNTNKHKRRHEEDTEDDDNLIFIT